MSPVALKAQSRSIPTGHLLPLDGVRGLAILMVVCSHSFESNYDSGSLPVRVLGHLFYYGSFGVDLFFVLSGFLITGILVDSLTDAHYLRNFYARRALRIFPLYYLVLLLCFALTRPLHLHWGSMGWLLPVYLQNLRPQEIVTFSAGSGIALFHFWSLAIEEQFYLVWPAIVLFVHNKRRLFCIMLGASGGALLLRLCLLAAGFSGFAIHVTTLCRADSLLMGGAAAVLFRSHRWAASARMASAGFLLAAGLIVASTLWLDPRLVNHHFAGLLWREGFRYSFLAVGFTCLIAWALQPGSAVQRIFTISWLRWLGKYSYGIYVFHVFALTLLNPLFRSYVLRATHSKLLAVAAAGGASMAISFAVAFASFELYERRFLRWKHRFHFSRDASEPSALLADAHRTAISSR